MWNFPKNHWPFILIAMTIFLMASCRSKPGGGTVTASTTDTFRVIQIVDTSMLRTSDNAAIDSLYDEYTAYLKGQITDSTKLGWFQDAVVYRLFYEKERSIKKFIPMAEKLKLPHDAKIIEVAYLADRGIPNRAIVLWMTSFKMSIEIGDLYTCPQVTSGTYSLGGIPHFSLIDVSAMKILNTETFTECLETETTDSASKTITRTQELNGTQIPMVIANPKYRDEVGGLSYHAIGGNDSIDGMAQVLYLDDYNGDGKRLEWALYNQFGCAMKASTLMGYSPRRDSIIRYPIQYRVYETVQPSNRDTTFMDTNYWADHEFCYRIDPKSNTLKFVMDYRGRGGERTLHELHYDKDKEIFYGIRDSRIRKENDSIGYSFCPVPIQY